VAAVEAHELVRTYVVKSGFVRRSSKRVEAVCGISFEIAAGELFGLLGPNGAGKTTTIKLLTTLLLPTSGRASVLGFDVATQTREVRRRIGYVFGGERGLYDRLTGLENLKYFADMYRVEPRAKAARIAELLETVGLTGREDERVEGYSRGMRQRLHIARGLLHDPPVVFLDEPTIGLDPVGARELRVVIGNLAAVGKAVLLTTHYMFEADALCDRIAVIDHGTVVAEGTPDALKRRVTGRSIVEIETFGADEPTLARLRAVPGVASLTVEQREQAQVLVVQGAAEAQLVQPLLHELEGIRVGRVSTREPTLEDAYVDLVSSP
jgi:ABC-2 type transport system ATP-binding protein